jgi:hypothetical protein
VNRTQIIEHFTEIGALFQQVADSKTDPKPSVFSDAFLEKFRHTVEREIHYNGWFEVEFIQKSLLGISTWLESVSLSNWSAPTLFMDSRKTSASSWRETFLWLASTIFYADWFPVTAFR